MKRNLFLIIVVLLLIFAGVILGSHTLALKEIFSSLLIIFSKRFVYITITPLFAQAVYFLEICFYNNIS